MDKESKEISQKCNLESGSEGVIKKPCPFCGGSVTQGFDDCGGSWIEHDVKSKKGSINICILTDIKINTTSDTYFRWDDRAL